MPTTARRRPSLECAALLLVVCATARGVAAGPGHAAKGGKPPGEVVHRLPFPGGVSYGVFQGNDQAPSHNDEWNRYAFDFSPMPVGSEVCATADGVVTYVKQDTTGPTGRVEDNNEIAILHADGTVGTYLHLAKDSALVAVDQHVFAGDLLGKSGDTGKAGGPHLHFGLKQGTRMGPSVPCRFAEVPGDGVPKTGDTVTSGNYAARPLREAFLRIETAYDRAVRLDCRDWIASRLVPLTKPQAPPEFAAILKSFGQRADVVADFDRRRDAVIARYRADGEQAVAAVASARAAGDDATAVALATLARLDYAPLDLASRLDGALGELRKSEGYAKLAQSVAATIAWRRDLARSLDAEAKAREKGPAAKKVDWDALAKAFDDLAKRAPSDERRAAVTAYAEELRAEKHG